MLDKQQINDFRHPAFQPITQAIGEVTLAWNGLHDDLGSLFWFFLDVPNGLIPGAVWHSIKVDTAQRDMLEAITKLPPHTLGLRMNDETREAVIFILDQTKKLIDRRNNAIHCPLVRTNENEIIPMIGIGHERAKKVSGQLKKESPKRDIRGDLYFLYDSITTLRKYTDDLSEALLRETVPFPLKPQMPKSTDSIYCTQVTGSNK